VAIAWSEGKNLTDGPEQLPSVWAGPRTSSDFDVAVKASLVMEQKGIRETSED
jgi:hypothetical protein